MGVDGSRWELPLKKYMEDMPKWQEMEVDGGHVSMAVDGSREVRESMGIYEQKHARTYVEQRMHAARSVEGVRKVAMD